MAELVRVFGEFQDAASRVFSEVFLLPSVFKRFSGQSLASMLKKLL